MRVERYGYLEQTKSASGIARKSWERVVTANGGLKGVCPTVRVATEIGYMAAIAARQLVWVPDGFGATNGLGVSAVR